MGCVLRGADDCLLPSLPCQARSSSSNVAGEERRLGTPSPRGERWELERSYGNPADLMITLGTWGSYGNFWERLEGWEPWGTRSSLSPYVFSHDRPRKLARSSMVY